MNEIIINKLRPTIIVANLVDSFMPLINIIVDNKVKAITGRFIAKGILSNKNGILSSARDGIRYSTNPYNINRMTAAAGIGAIKDKEYFVNNCKDEF